MNTIFNKLDAIKADTKAALGRFMGDEEMYLKYIRSFPEEPTMEALRGAVAEKDYNAAEKKVHALKGLTDNLGFLPLTDAAVDMLEELRDKNIEAALDAYADVEKQYKKFCDIIHTWQEEN